MTHAALDDVIFAIVDARDGEGADYVVIGALAVNAWGFARATQDVCVAIDARDRPAVLELLTRLEDRGFRVNREAVAVSYSTVNPSRGVPGTLHHPHQPRAGAHELRPPPSLAIWGRWRSAPGPSRTSGISVTAPPARHATGGDWRLYPERVRRVASA